jgi:hypothetical protein
VGQPNKNTMATKSQLYTELATILQTTCTNVHFEAKRTDSELLRSVCATLSNLAAFAQNIGKDIQELENSKRVEMNLKNEAYMFILENGLLDKFREYTQDNNK